MCIEPHDVGLYKYIKNENYERRILAHDNSSNTIIFFDFTSWKNQFISFVMVW